MFYKEYNTKISRRCSVGLDPVCNELVLYYIMSRKFVYCLTFGYKIPSKSIKIKKNPNIRNFI